MASPTWFWMDTGPAGGAENMALDEALMISCGQWNAPILRFYSWTEPAATFGYFQKHVDIANLTPLRPLLRRPTGGGLVPHDQDWTYSLSFPATDPWFSLRAEESYRKLHEWIRDSFRRLGIETFLSPCCAKEAPGQCFAGPERFDLLWQSRKIAGAAQRRSKQGLLIQGSLQRQPPAVERASWQRALKEVAASTFGIEWRASTLSPDLRALTDTLLATKYALASYHQKR